MIMGAWKNAISFCKACSYTYRTVALILGRYQGERRAVNAHNLSEITKNGSLSYRPLSSKTMFDCFYRNTYNNYTELAFFNSAVTIKKNNYCKGE